MRWTAWCAVGAVVLCVLGSCGGGGGDGASGAVDAVEIRNETGWDLKIYFTPQTPGGRNFNVDVPFQSIHMVPGSQMPAGLYAWTAYTSGINQFPNPCGANNCEVDGFGALIFNFADRIAPHFLLVDGE